MLVSHQYNYCTTILIADVSTILLNVPLGSGNKSSKTVFGAGLKYYCHFNAETADYSHMREHV